MYVWGNIPQWIKRVGQAQHDKHQQPDPTGTEKKNIKLIFMIEEDNFFHGHGG